MLVILLMIIIFSIAGIATSLPEFKNRKIELTFSVLFLVAASLALFTSIKSMLDAGIPLY